MMTSQQRSTWPPAEPIETPFRKARQEWDLRLGTSTMQALNWRRATFGMIGVVLVSVIGNIYLGVQPKAEPYLIQIDKLGAPTFLGPVERGTSTAPPSESIRYHLRRFIDDVRSVSSDPAILKTHLLDAYRLVSPQAANELNAWIHDHNPLERVGLERVSVEVAGLLPLSATSWQADWTETIWDDAGGIKAQSVWRATFRLQFRRPQTEDEIVANPIGLFVDEFHWSQLRVEESPKSP